MLPCMMCPKSIAAGEHALLRMTELYNLLPSQLSTKSMSQPGDWTMPRMTEPGRGASLTEIPRMHVITRQSDESLQTEKKG